MGFVFISHHSVKYLGVEIKLIQFSQWLLHLSCSCLKRKFIFSILKMSWTTLIQSPTVELFDNRFLVIVFLLARDKILCMYLFLGLFTVSGINPKYRVSNLNGITTSIIFSMIWLVSFQYLEITGQFQNIWKCVALFSSQDLQYEVLAPGQLFWAGTLKNLITVFVL